jgi:hypothetical protein
MQNRSVAAGEESFVGMVWAIAREPRQGKPRQHGIGSSANLEASFAVYLLLLGHAGFENDVV